MKRQKHQLYVYARISLKSQVAVCFVYCTSTINNLQSTVSCFFINCQGPVVLHAPCQVEIEATPALLLGVLSLTPVTQGTWGLQVVLVEHVSQMASGQGVIQPVHVSPHYVISYPLHTSYKHAKELLVLLVYTTIHSISKKLIFGCSHYLKLCSINIISALSTVHQVYCVMFLYQLSGSCGTPRSLSNGQRRSSRTTVESRVTYTCNSGYRMTAGSSSRTCQSDGQWSGSHPTCTRKYTLCHFISFTYRLQACKIIPNSLADLKYVKCTVEGAPFYLSLCKCIWYI